MNRTASLASAVCLAAILVGCHGSDRAGPPIVRYGEEACAHCRMIISDERFAAALVSQTGETAKFDDVGCLLDYRAVHTGPVKRSWVADYQSMQWLDAPQAAYVQSTKLPTPMGFGIAALSTSSEASRLAEEFGGTILRFEELSTSVNTPGKTQQH